MTGHPRRATVLTKARSEIGARLAYRSPGGPAAARNRGVELAQSPIILFLDDDIVATPSLIKRHLSHHQDGGDDLAVIGPMLSPPETELSSPIRWEQAMLYKQYDAMARGQYEPTYRQFFTGNASVRRTSVEAAGGFDLRFRRNEDVELAYRMHVRGVKFVFDPEAGSLLPDPGRGADTGGGDRGVGAWPVRAGTAAVLRLLAQGGSLDDAPTESVDRAARLLAAYLRHLIGREPATLQLRYLQTLTELASEKNSTIVFPLPIELMRAFLPADKK